MENLFVPHGMIKTATEALTRRFCRSALKKEDSISAGTVWLLLFFFLTNSLCISLSYCLFGM